MAATALLILSWTAALVVVAAALDMSPVPFDVGYSPLFGGDNLVRSPDGRIVKLRLDRYTGSGFVSKSAYHHGFFSASIKLPDGHTAGVVVAFYLSNGDVYEKQHDELDFELLGNRLGHDWHLQTNMYGNGSTARGREERYLLPQSQSHGRPHRYAIAWTPNTVIFYLDGAPIREIVRTTANGSGAADFPSKPMSVYATIWDGSAWATDGGRHKLDYAHAPFVAEFSDLVLRGCRHHHHARRGECELDLMTADCAVITPAKRAAMRRFRDRYLTYTVCRDRVRYKDTAVFPECDVDGDGGDDRFHVWGEVKRVTPRRGSSPQLHASSTF